MTETDSKTAVGYTRLSQQSDTSIDTQKREIQDYCEEHGLKLDRIYNDGEQSSGFSPDELTEWNVLRDAICNGNVDAIVVRGKRRLARDIDEVMRFIPDVRQHGVELHVVQDEGKLDLSDPIKAAIEILQAAAAFEEKLAEIEKSLQMTKNRQENGYWMGDAPYGTEFGVSEEFGKRLVPKSGEWEDVERVLALREDGLSYREIEDETGVAYTTAWRIWQRRAVYEKARNRAERHGIDVEGLLAGRQY